MAENKRRFIFFFILIGLLTVALIARLFYLQIVRGQQYMVMSTQRYTTSMVEKAPRGEILDRYGKPLVTNRVGYSLVLQKTDISDEQLNEVLLKILQILEGSEYEYSDTLPISGEPYAFDFTDDNGSGSTDDEREAWFKDKKSIKPEMTAEQVMEAYKKAYHVSEGYTMAEERRIIGMRYELSMRGFSLASPFVIANDVDLNVVTKIKERQDEFEGVIVTKDYIRNYDEGSLAAHIVGRVGKMDAKEYAQYKDDGYGYNDIVGKQGIEKLMEKYLRGTDGTQGIEQNVNGNIVTLAENVPAVTGNYVMLTLDLDLQKAAEESLQRNIEKIRAAGGAPSARRGGDCNAGAAVVIDIKTGDALVCATYPTYHPADFSKDYKTLLNDENKPMWNRAISGTYTPGSTFKPLTAIAGLEGGAITTKETIVDEGVYRVWNDYQPSCWIWSEQHRTHGRLNVSGAIENSCNYFFYEVGRRLGIDAIDKYASDFGLGELTGIELTEEKAGNVSSPAYKEKTFKSAADKKWYGGDTIQTAIGQSYNSFTPIQLANYAATIANGGTRYKTNIIKNVRSSTDGTIITEVQPSVVKQNELKPSTLEAVKEGMKRVVDEGSASGVFDNYPIPIGGKTGTAQVGKTVTNNALFIAFAPFDDPEIAVCVVLEHGLRGANAGYVAKDILDEYFKLNDTQPSGTDASSAPMTGTRLLP